MDQDKIIKIFCLIISVFVVTLLMPYLGIDRTNHVLLYRSVWVGLLLGFYVGMSYAAKSLRKS